MFSKTFLAFSYLVAVAMGKATELSNENFQSFIETNEKTLVKFYAPWCGHCKKMAPEFDAAAEILEGVAQLAKVDLDNEDNKPLAAEFAVQGFPTLKFFDNGRAMEYTGGRTKDEIVNWVNQMSGPASTEISDRNTAFEAATSGAILAYCGDIGPKSGEYALFKKTADGNRGSVRFMAYPCDPKEQPELELIRPDGTSTKHPLVSTYSEEEIMQFVKGESLPYFGVIGPENAADYANSGLEVVYFGGSVSDYEAVKEEVIAVAKSFRGTYTFTFLDADKYSRQAEGMLRTTKFPSFVLPVAQGKKGTYKIEDPEKFTTTVLSKWIKDISEGNVQPELQSEPVPESQDEAVKVAVGNNFAELIADDVDAMVEIYAPWCGHCKQLAPEYDSAAEAVAAKAPKVVIAKIDGTANDIPSEDYAFTGFPTLYWKKAGQKPTRYEGGRTAKDIIDFIAKNSSTPFDVSQEDQKESKDEL